MNLLQIIDMLCDVTTKQSDLLRRLVNDLENLDQVSEETKLMYREEFDEIENELDITEYGSRDIPMLEEK